MLFKHITRNLVVVASIFVAAGCAPVSIAELVPESSRATIDLESAALSLAVGADAIWVVGGGKVLRIDPKRYIVTQSLSIPGHSIAVRDDAVWVASFNALTLNAQPGVVYRIDPRTNQIVAKVQVGMGSGGIAVGKNAVWVANYRDASVSRIDALSNRVVSTIEVGDGPDAIAVGEGAVWVANRYGSVTRINPQTNSVVATIATGRWTHGLAVGAGRVWVIRAVPTLSGLEGAVLQIDPRTNRLVGDPIPVGLSAWSVVVGHGSVWVSNTTEYSVSRIDPVTNQVKATLRVPCPFALAISENRVWVTHQALGRRSSCRNAISSITP